MEDWIESYGACPVPAGTLIDVKYRDGKVLAALPALEDVHGEGRSAVGAFWKFDNFSNDIVAYRLAEGAPKSIGDLFRIDTSVGYNIGIAAEPAVMKDTSVTDVNPKNSNGKAKLPLHLWPGLATAYGAVGLAGGALRYGEGNFKATPVLMSIYLAAILRHTYAIIEGQEFDEIDGSAHIGAILANCAIIVEARAVGTLVDDRPLTGGYLKETEQLTAQVAHLNEMYAHCKPRNYTIADNP